MTRGFANHVPRQSAALACEIGDVRGVGRSSLEPLSVVSSPGERYGPNIRFTVGGAARPQGPSAEASLLALMRQVLHLFDLLHQSG